MQKKYESIMPHRLAKYSGRRLDFEASREKKGRDKPSTLRGKNEIMQVLKYLKYKGRVMVRGK